MEKHKNNKNSKKISEKRVRKPQRSSIKENKESKDELIRLNKYVANSGVCSRREADKLITSGIIKVNGIVVTELGTKIHPNDKVDFGQQTIKNEKPVYLLLNKPKDYISTMDDPQGRKTVLDLVRKACRERIYPVGRLDRNTTGLLLFTNDGDLAKKLIHPKYKVKKIYNVLLDKKLTAADMEKIAGGMRLDDETVQIDAISYVVESQHGNDSRTNKGKREVGIELHSGQNRVVRRIFENLGYDVLKLDRIYFAGLTKKDLQRGKWRFLSEKEISLLKMGMFR